MSLLFCVLLLQVQLLLEAKKIPYAIKKENMNCYGPKSADFLKKNPGGLLPVIMLDGKLVTESIRIMFLLEETFQAPYPKLIPNDHNGKMQAFQRYLRLERVFLGAWLTVLRRPAELFSVSNQIGNCLEFGGGSPRRIFRAVFLGYRTFICRHCVL